MDYWRRWAPLFDPRRALHIEEVGELYQPRVRPPHLAIERRLRRAAPGAPGIKTLVVGSRGSGKSTELARLAFVIRDAYLPIRVDLSGAFDHGSSAVDLLVLLAAGVERTARDWGLQESRRRHDLHAAVYRLGLTAADFSALVSALEPVGAALGAPGVAAVGGGALRVVGAVTRQLLRPLNREDAATDHASLIASLNEATLDLRVAGVNDEPVLFLLEGLDKLTDLDTIRSAFRDVDLLTEVAAPIVLTAPVAVRHQAWITSGVLQKFDLWNAAVVHRDGSRNDDGVGELRGMFERRAEAASAPADLVARDALDEAASCSSGNAREFFRLLEGAMDRADELGKRRVDAADVAHAVVGRRHELQIALRSEQLEVLMELLASPGPLPSGSDADELLYENFIACYAGDGPDPSLLMQDAWFRPHQILVPYLERLRGGG